MMPYKISPVVKNKNTKESLNPWQREKEGISEKTLYYLNCQFIIYDFMKS